MRQYYKKIMPKNLGFKYNIILFKQKYMCFILRNSKVELHSVKWFYVDVIQLWNISCKAHLSFYFEQIIL